MATLAPIRFASFVFDPQHRLLTRDGVIVALGRPESAILAVLLARRGGVAGKGELIAAAWPGLAREESNLSVQIARLRRKIGPDIIRTVGRVGYRLVDPAAPSRVRFNRGSVRRRITVAGFAVGGAIHLGIAAEQIAEDLTVALSRFPAIAVLDVESGEGAEYQVEGALRDTGGALRLYVQLVDTGAGTILWADAYAAATAEMQRASGDLVARVAAAVDSGTQAAEIERSQRERPDSAEPYDLYLRAEALLRTSNIDDNAAAIVLCEQAIAAEPENVAFLAAACGGMHQRIAMGWPALTADDARRCNEYAMRGLSLAKQDGDALALFGSAVMMTGDPDLGYATMQHAARINPYSVHAIQIAGQANMHWGNLDTAIEQFERAHAINPTDHSQRFILGSMARIRLIRRDFTGAMELALRAFATNRHYNPVHWALIATAAQLGRAEQAGRYLARFKASNPGVTLARIANGRPSVGNRNASLLDGLEAAGLR